MTDKGTLIKVRDALGVAHDTALYGQGSATASMINTEKQQIAEALDELNVLIDGVPKRMSEIITRVDEFYENEEKYNTTQQVKTVYETAKLLSEAVRGRDVI